MVQWFSSSKPAWLLGFTEPGEVDQSELNHGPPLELWLVENPVG